jgi:hypothetical protein
MNEIIKGSWARAYCNDEFICVETVSGYRGGTHTDPRGKQLFLSVDTVDESLGSAVIDVLTYSRWVLAAPREGSLYPSGVEFDSNLYDLKQSNERYVAWTRSVMEQYGYKTKQELFKRMKNCSIEKKLGVITISPSHHEKLESWEGLGFDDPDLVRIPENSSLAEIGTALRLAFSRCTG